MLRLPEPKRLCVACQGGLRRAARMRACVEGGEAVTITQDVWALSPSRQRWFGPRVFQFPGLATRGDAVAHLKGCGQVKRRSKRFRIGRERRSFWFGRKAQRHGCRPLAEQEDERQVAGPSVLDVDANAVRYDFHVALPSRRLRRWARCECAAASRSDRATCG